MALSLTSSRLIEKPISGGSTLSYQLSYNSIETVHILIF